jgi:anti-sigma B factor antagonist
MGSENDAINDVLSISGRRDGTAALVTLVGELDLHGAGRLDDEVRRVLAAPVSSLEIDASGLEYVDSSGLRSMMLAKSEAETAGAAFRLTGVSSTVGRVIEIAGLAELLLPAEPNPT